MKTIVVVSDNHYTPIPEKLKSVINEADYFFWLGDGISMLGDLLFHKGLYAVNGNNDYHAFPIEEVVEIEGVRCFLTHGHAYGVRQSYLPLRLRAEELGCNAVFFGHTHEAYEATDHGITFVNPGALCSPINPTYAYCVVTGDKIITKTVSL